MVYRLIGKREDKDDKIIGIDSNVIMLDMVPHMQRRIEAAAMLKGVSTKSYCIAAIDSELARDEAKSTSDSRFDRQAFERVVTRRGELFEGIPLPGDSVELIREAREERDAQTENWA